MGLSRAAKERALHAIVDDTWLGVATGKQDGALLEVNDPAYRRQRVPFGEVKHGERSEIANASDVLFPPFALNAAAELRHWFLISTPAGEGVVATSGPIEPRGMIDPATGVVLLMDEVKAQKDAGVSTMAYKNYYPRPVAGEELRFVPGQIAVYIGDMEES